VGVVELGRALPLHGLVLGRGGLAGALGVLLEALGGPLEHLFDLERGPALVLLEVAQRRRQPVALAAQLADPQGHLRRLLPVRDEEAVHMNSGVELKGVV